jgi:hypothetical protein
MDSSRLRQIEAIPFGHGTRARRSRTFVAAWRPDSVPNTFGNRFLSLVHGEGGIHFLAYHSTPVIPRDPLINSPHVGRILSGTSCSCTCRRCRCHRNIPEPGSLRYGEAERDSGSGYPGTGTVKSSVSGASSRTSPTRTYRAPRMLKSECSNLIGMQ